MPNTGPFMKPAVIFNGKHLTKVFNGKRYDIQYVNRDKREAVAGAKRLRASGYLVRVVKALSGSGYDIYLRPRSKEGK